MELLLPTAIPTSSFPTPPPHKSKTSNPLLFSNTAGSFKTHFRSSNLSLIQTPRPLNPIQASSNGLSSSASSAATTSSHFETQCTHWMVLIDKPPDGVSSKSDVVNFYVSTLAMVLGSEKDAQMCIYDASWERNYGFCCDIDEETSRRLADLPGVVSVRPDTDFESAKKDYSFSNLLLGHLSKANGGANQLSSDRSSKYWLVCMEKPGIEVVTKAQVVDYYAQTLTKVLGNEMDAQMCLYDISWQNHFGFCCEIDEQCAQELADVPGVLSVQPDLNYGSSSKDYGGSEKLNDSSDTNQTPRTKRLFVTGLSFYTSEKTLRAAFEGFGELVEVKIIMDKISKRSKGYAFIEYTTEEAAAAALKEMNGKIINGWMIVVDVAKTNPPRHNRVRPGPTV